MSNRPNTTRPDPPAIPDPLRQPTITIDEAAALLGVCRASMYQAAKEGQCPIVRIGAIDDQPATHQIARPTQGRSRQNLG